MCPCHASEFDLRTGDVLCPPALEPLPIYEARVEEGELQVRLAPPPAAAEAVHEREDHVSESVARAATTAGPSLDGLVLDDVDLTDLDVWEQGVPYEWLTLLRREAPLFWQPEADGRGFWVFTRYDDIVQVSKDWETYSSELGGTSLEDLTPEEVEARKSMLDTDPPAHTRLRALVNKGFTPRVVNTYEERIRGLARGILAQAFERDSFDWVEDVASEIPMWVFSEIMGLPVDDRRLLIELGDKLLGNTDPEVVGEENVRDLAATDPSIRLLPFSSPFARRPDRVRLPARRGAPHRSARRHHDEARRGRDRRLAALRARVRRSSSSSSRRRATRRRGTRSASACSTCSRTPTRPRGSSPTRRSRAPPPTRSSAAPTPCTTSAAPRRQDVAVHGRRIKAGDKVTMWYAAGNYDEEKFADPYRLDLGRAAEPAPHLRSRRAALLPRRAPREARGEDLARGDDPVPRPHRARRPADAPALELLQRHQAPARAGALLTTTRRHGVESRPRGRGSRPDDGRARRPRDPAALHRPARRRPRQGHPDRPLRRHVRGGRRLLRGRDGHRPPAHAGRRRRGGLRRLRDQARPRHAARRAVAAGGGLVPRRGLDARRLRALAVVPAGAAPPGRRRVRGARADADRRPRARVLPRRARPSRDERPPPLRRRALPRLHGRRRLRSARDRAQDAALVRRPRAAGVRREPRVHELAVRDQRQALGARSTPPTGRSCSRRR